ncbi:MAG TPA: hypothetical protein VJH03_01860 [Blastocatellia bacterium]|nr:hypothetical protein [Blastocatellia bacterium]
MDDNRAKTQPTLETIVEMLKSLQLDVAEMKLDIAAVKEEQHRQAKQLDKMAQYVHGFGSDLYELRLEFREFREAVTNALPQLASHK